MQVNCTRQKWSRPTALRYSDTKHSHQPIFRSAISQYTEHRQIFTLLHRVERGKLPNFLFLNAVGVTILGIFIPYESGIYRKMF
jgi:hypothetical protein